jgi:hypothetical protein
MRRWRLVVMVIMIVFVKVEVAGGIKMKTYLVRSEFSNGHDV